MLEPCFHIRLSWFITAFSVFAERKEAAEQANSNAIKVIHFIYFFLWKQRHEVVSQKWGQVGTFWIITKFA